MAKERADALEVAKRVEEVLRIRLDGAQHHDVLEYAASKGWNVTDRQVRNYLARADALLVKRRESSRKKLLARHCAQRESLFARAVNAADLRTALAVVDSLAKLQGLFTDARDLRELARLAASQGARVLELERRLADSGRDSPGATTPGAAPGPTAGADAADGGATRPLPPEPAEPDA